MTAGDFLLSSSMYDPNTNNTNSVSAHKYRIKMAEISAITPPSLFGIERTILNSINWG